MIGGLASGAMSKCKPFPNCSPVIQTFAVYIFRRPFTLARSNKISAVGLEANPALNLLPGAGLEVDLARLAQRRRSDEGGGLRAIGGHRGRARRKEGRKEGEVSAEFLGL